MKRLLSCSVGMIGLAIGLIASTAFAATANGPYYATPSWDQKLDPATRFIILLNWNSEAVLDRETGLVWERSPSTSHFHWENVAASFHCHNRSVGHRKGWRLPTIQELASLVDSNPANTSNPRLPLGHPFLNVQSDLYWSATSVARGVNVWTLNFLDGFVEGRSVEFELFVWCVRGGQGPDAQ